MRFESGEVSQQAVWRPGDFLAGDTLPSFEMAQEKLRSLGTSVINAWSSALGPVAVAASGGVDSSFICAALKSGGAAFSCLTVATNDSSGDERAHVRQLAEHLEVPWREAFYEMSRFDPIVPASTGLARPSRKSFLGVLDRLFAEGAAASGSEIVFDGNGGDNLFCFLHSAAPIVDRLLCEGAGPGSFATFMDMCRLTGCDALAMIRSVWRVMRNRSQPPSWPPDTRLLRSAGQAIDDPVPFAPWVDAWCTGLPGKDRHLDLLMHSQYHIHGLSEGLPRFSPLLSQPLLEFCLSVPTWLWCKGGRNRALARAAFARDLPRAIVSRTSKAGPDSFLREAYAASRKVIRDRLMGGLLMENGILDRNALTDALETDRLTGDSVIYRILDLAEAENWARSWHG